MDAIRVLLGYKDDQFRGAFTESVPRKCLDQFEAFLSDATDYQFEQELAKNGSSVKGWVSYLKAKKNADSQFRIALYLRAVERVPRSYKLWMALFDEAELWIGDVDPDCEELKAVEMLYKRAIAHLPKAPLLRIRFAQFLWKRRKLVTAARHVYNDALQALPLTQHAVIWDAYITFAQETDLPELIRSIMPRYLQILPDYTEAYVVYLMSIGEADEAVKYLSGLWSDDAFVSIRDMTSQEIWMELCSYIAEHAKEIKCVDGPSIMRSGLRRYADSVATIWCSLAVCYAVAGSFDRSVDVYEEALASVHTVEDFTHVYDNYSKFLESMVNKQMEVAQKNSKSLEIATELKYRISLLSSLIERRAEMLSSVRIRRNPHSVIEWLNRARIYIDTSRPIAEEEDGCLDFVKSNVKDGPKVIAVFSEAVSTVDPFKAKGNYALLWIEFARLYEVFGDLVNARKVLERGCEVDHKLLDTLVSLWCERIELELRYGDGMAALNLARQAVRRPPKVTEESEEVRNQHKLGRSVRLWSLLADLEENFGTFEAMRTVYSRMFDLKTITVQQVFILAEILEKRKFYEDAFQVYERALHLFRWPHCYHIWIVYLSKFVARYGSKKVDRARELFEEAVSEVPKQFALHLFFMYAKFEEHYGLIRQTLAIYHRAAQKVKESERLQIYQILVATTAQYFGITKTRPLFDEAIQRVPDDDILTVGLKYAELEMSLMELDRARAVFEHISQFADPEKNADFWATWRAFEVAHGDESTFREMLRKKRAVSAQFEEAKGLQFDEELLKELKERTS